MSLKTLLNVPLILSKLNQAYAIINPDGDVLWANAAFQKIMDHTLLSQFREEFSAEIEVDSCRQFFPKEGEYACIEVVFQAYSEIDPEREEDLYLCLCRTLERREKVEAKSERENSEARMTGLLNESQHLAKIGAWELDLVTKLTIWTDEVYRIHEVERDFYHHEETGLNFYHPDDRHIIIGGFERSISHREEFDVVTRFITAKDNLIWVRVTGKPCVENGEVVRLIGLIQNITDRIKIEHQLIEEQTQLRLMTERFQLASEAAGIGIWDYYPVENNLVWDKQTYKLYGVNESEFEGAYEAWERNVHPDDKEAAVNELGLALSGEKEFDTEFRVLLSDGTIRHLSGIATVIRNEQNEPIRMTGVNTDITESKQHLDQLNLLQSVVETTLDAIIITEANLDKQKILYANPAHEQMTGYNLEEIMGESPRIFQGPLTDQRELKRVRNALEQGENIQSELLNYGKDGREFWVNMIVTYVRDQKGAISHFVSVQRDISEQKKNQQALVEAKEIAENASEAKSEFLSTMSHEIRTPLNAVIGMTGLLAETDLDEEQASYLDTIKNGGESLLAVINDILDYSKIEAGKIELEEETFRLLDPVENTLDLLAGKASEKHIELMYQVEKPVPKFVIGDITRLSQILINLIGNAIKFTDGGEILVKVRQLELSNGKISLEFSIKDTGIGIPKEKMDQLFQSFSQVDASTTRKFGGTGLGLAISRKLVELQNGKIWVESEVGVGSTFFFTVVLDHVDGSADPDIEKASLKEKRVLIVDDNQTNLTILHNQLSDVGMEVTTCISPKEALEYIDKQKSRGWDLCILDCHMPEMDGFALGTILRQKPLFKEIPMLMMSSANIGRDEAQKDIFNLILNKPVKKEILIDQLRTLLGAGDGREFLSLENEKKAEIDISGYKILLAEDNPINQKVAKKMLEKFQGNLEIASNGLEALELISVRPFDLVLMDMQMPEMDGIQATLAIRQLRKIKQPLIYAMTANVSEGDRKACLEAGMDGFISKPIKLDVLREILRKCLL